MAIRTTTLLLICGAGFIASVGGWLLGEQLFLQRASASLTPDDAAPFEERYPVSNAMTKQDRVIASPGLPEAADSGPPNDMMETARAWMAAPVTLPRAVLAKPEKPSRLFLNDTQIAGIKKRLNLTTAQQRYWPPVENALRAVTLQIEDYQKRLKKSRDDSFDTESAAVTELKAATKALYAQLSGQQKNDIMLLVRMAGLGPAFAELTNTKVTPVVEKDD